MISHQIRLYLIVVCFSSLAGCLLYAQVLKPGPQVLSFHSTVDDTDQPYAIYLPPNFNAKKQYPLVISLHGAGSNHRLNLRRVFGKSNAPGETDVEASRSFPKWADIDYIVASPYARGTMGYEGVAEKDVYDVMADVKERFPIDENRIYLTGLSMGGGGTLWLALTRPDIWAAIAPVCPAPPQGTETLAPNALSFPVRFCQGGADPVVRPAGVRDWAKRLETLGTKVEYIEYPGVGHNSWENAYQDEKIFQWFGQFKRNPHPDRVRFVSNRFKYNKSFWVELDALTPGTLATIDARFTGNNQIELTASELQGFTLNLAGHPRYNAKHPVEITIDGKKVEAAGKLSFHQESGVWTAGKREAGPDAKRPGAEGPMGEVISSRHIYVYGTADNPPSAEMQARLRLASKAAEWSVDRGWFMGRVMVFPRVVADKDVRPSDLESSNLVLFGTRETNKLIAQFSDRLPMQLSKDSQDYGLLYVFPIGEHYVLVSSGLPWWQTPEAGATRTSGGTGRRGSPFSGPIPAFALTSLEDYLLFKGSADNPVAAGRFDTNWRLPAAEAAKIKTSAVVTVKE